MPGRDEEFQRQIREAAERSKISSGVVLGGPSGVPPRTVTEITLQNNTMILAKLTDEEGEIAGYQIRFMDPFLNRIIVFGMSPENAIDLFADFQELLTGEEASDPKTQPPEI